MYRLSILVLLLSALLVGCQADPAAVVPVESGPVPDLGLDLQPVDLRRLDAPVPDASLGTGPPYPIVLVHGFFGFDEIGPLEYYYGVKAALEDAGHVVVVTAVDPFNTTYVRGNQLLHQINVALAQTGAAKVNIVAHSQGGFDARYVASIIPQRIGAVVTVSTPHVGARIADLMLEKTPGFTRDLAKAFFAAVARPLYGDVADDADLKACLDFMASDSVAQFNTKYPDDPRVSYYSIAGRSGSDLAEKACFAPKAPPFITQYDEVKDPVDPLLYLIHKVLGGSLLDPKPSDGLVLVEEAKWGTWLGCIPADHWDAVGQLLGDSPGSGNTFDHKTFYRDVAAFLVAEGF